MNNREANNNPHPPSCNCQNCVQARLERFKKEGPALLGFRSRIIDKVTPSARLNQQVRRKGVNGKSRTGLKKLSLNLIVIVCLIAAVWIGYRLFYLHALPPIIGSILFIADSVITIWCIAILRSAKYRNKRPGFLLTVASLLAILLVFAFAGVEPISAAKDKMTSWMGIQTINKTESKVSANTPTSKTSNSPPPAIIKEYFLAGLSMFPNVIELNKIQQWVYSSSRQLDFKSLNPPYVVNVAIRTKTSQVATNLTVRVYRKNDPYKLSSLPITTRTISGMGGRQAFIIEEKGDYVIDVQSVGCEWWAMVGHETEAYRQ